ncbi:uncharacterized protein LOC143921641 [Arctopsyche grandis]|uniref:uncharacterized protein LOC143921641 n=1 Tax=Arctopsyche grandis TaxID=121162 RepID=UPI00406D8B49
MISLKGFFLTAFLALSLFFLQSIDGQRRCTKNNYYCPNTTLNYDLTNEVELREAHRQFTRYILSSQMFNELLSNEGRKFVAEILKRINTDSPRELYTYYMFSYRSLMILINRYDYPSLCNPARLINASISWETSRDGNAMAAALRLFSIGVFTTCKMVQVASLTALGCDNVPDVPTIPSKCYKRGLVYPVEENLRLFGSYLPCSLQLYVLNLYSSKRYSDNVLAAMFSVALGPFMRQLTAALNQNVLLETFNMLLYNNVSICCCPKRNRRFNEMCVFHNASIIASAETIIDTQILVDECATEVYGAHT